ncbi:hypothetical protein Bind_0046 [Beijerinckia indica subsp. indica ATCC 9039]|uniref:Uncharacterized protein n=2 Tax=Beijerinckia TaxID=532 RepID=B2IB05_BEII9|nr:hypothetical protein Bind_0046 [Beijerinckia indica subsp. indica ATCC 9039]
MGEFRPVQETTETEQQKAIRRVADAVTVAVTGSTSTLAESTETAQFKAAE